MNLNDIKQLFLYNTWANNSMFEAVSELSNDQYYADMKTGQGSIHGTLTHIVAAHKMWLSRWKGTPDKELLNSKTVPTLQELKHLWETVTLDTTYYLNGLTEESLLQTLSMTTTKGITYTHPYGQMMQHLINHSTFHRGQLATLLRQFDIRPPQTDLIAYYRIVG